MWKTLIRRSQPIFFAIALIFMVLLLRSQWDELRDYNWQLQPLWLAASALLLLASWVVEIGIWRHLLTLVGGRLAYVPAVRIWFLSAIMRYIPGNIWQPLSMTVQAQQRGVRVEATLTSVALYQAIILLAVAPIAGVYLLSTGNLGLLTDLLGALTPLLALLAVVPVLVLLIRPQLLTAAINWALGKVGRDSLETELTSGRLLALLLVAAFDWLLWGGSFAALTFGLSEFSQAEMMALAPHLIATYSIAYAIGFISFITPSGFGVREGAFYLLLAPILGGGVITVAALAMRLWTTVGELIMAGLSLLLVPAPAKAGTATAVESLAEER
jgi:hypothetical protein